MDSNSTSDVKLDQDTTRNRSFSESFHNFAQAVHHKVWGDTKWAQSFHDKVWGSNDNEHGKSESDLNKN
ncbi:unnamed protein product [Adineta steineri]|uniref:Uncharacterized protein n=1 Tax=Adineta steineri TaxID=433720 RepID=A0A813U1A6_9BILA|nr:unnamed protein product [Adineta steineri]CAF1074902.1 unnamed protein product [Adineta steineri]CAF1283644.1 unnamed protein product [Adineta steineri]